MLVDESTHGGDTQLLKLLGVCDEPSGVSNIGDFHATIQPEQRPLFDDWLKSARTLYRQSVTSKSSPHADSLLPLRIKVPKSWPLLAKLKGLANARLTGKLLDLIEPLDQNVDFGHSTQPHYDKIRLAHPMRWFVREHGAYAIGEAAIPLKTVLAKGGVAALRQVSGWTDFEATRLDSLMELVGAPDLRPLTKKEVIAFWQALFGLLATPDAVANDALHDLWSSAAEDDEVPRALSVPGGERPLTEVYVTGSSYLAKRGKALGKTVVTLNPKALGLWLQQGAQNLDALFKPEWSEANATVSLLLSAVPELADVMSDTAKADALCRTVRDLQLVIDRQTGPVPCIHWKDELLIDSDQMDRLPRVERLNLILREADAAGWLCKPFNEAQREIADEHVEARRLHVSEGATLEERLMRAVSGRREPLLTAIGGTAEQAISSDNTDLQVALLALAMLGPTVLQALRSELDQEGLRPPKRWGGAEARKFVAALGFPEIFAAAPASKREAEEAITGPIHLPCLHDYQDEVIQGLRTLIESGTGRRRAVVSLPTGAGKTRVTVQAAVDFILKPEEGQRSVLWVAQTDELCEQAVQAFRQVWLNRGAQRTDLRIIRFWGGHKNPAPSEQGQPTAAVASIQTLNSRIGTEHLNWLSNPGLVVVDECHHAITPSYTGLLRWLDAEPQRSGTQKKDEPPIIGLSATPFRSASDDEENVRLAKRFDQRWLPSDQEALHERLTDRGILSVAKPEELPSHSTPPLDLIEKLVGARESRGPALENLMDQLNDFLAGDKSRSEMLTETIAASSQKSILLFANSVEHAKEMAARLVLRGIGAAAVSGETSPSARRYFLEQFQREEIRVLCNYNVLTTGFDAPKTDMVMIARQVWSAVRYMQMVGRGLRGVENGGTRECRIVTVLDNLGRFAAQQPYCYCARFFRN